LKHEPSVPHPEDFATMLGIAVVGPATVRSLALLAEIIFKAPVSQRDPAVRMTCDNRPESSRPMISRQRS
jgi:hypothetical protein